jgi:aspartate kinase
MALLAMALERRGVEAISFTGSQSGIITNDRHTGARIIEVRPVRIEDELARGRVVIIAGFQGMSYRREITTLGRGGTDATAVAMAAALGASWCEICSDVDGVYSSDPRVVPNARRIDEISYDEMAELALHGAKVLNAEAVAWAERANIEILARATRSAPPGTGVLDGTRVTRAVALDAKGARARAVTATQLVTVVVGTGILEVAIAERISLRAVVHTEEGTELRFVRDDVPDWPRIKERLEGMDARIRHVSEITVVGPSVGTDAGTVARIVSLTAEHCGGAVGFTVRASPQSITVALGQPVVASYEVTALTRALHDALVLP